MILVFPVLRAVALHTLSTAVLDISTSNITRASNESFTLTLEGQARKVGIFPAHLYFERPVYVHWISRSSRLESPLGTGGSSSSLNLSLMTSPASLVSPSVSLLDTSEEGEFGADSAFLSSSRPHHPRVLHLAPQIGERPSQGIRLHRSQQARVRQGEHRSDSPLLLAELTFSLRLQDLTLPGMANMTDVFITDFQLPGDDPAGGISLSVQTQFTNPRSVVLYSVSLVPKTLC
jgi:hypothetical protein